MNSAMILNIGDDDFVTVYGIDFESEDLKVDYRYTGNKSLNVVEQLLNERILKALDLAMETLEND